MIILDTCALVWLVDSPSNLSSKALDAIREQSSSLCVVPISAWEIAVKGGQRGDCDEEKHPSVGMV